MSDATLSSSTFETIPLRSSKFRQEREAQWAELEAIIKRFESGGAKRLSDEQLLALPKLYRAALSSLSVARATSLDQGVVSYLETLCARSYYALYGSPGQLGPRIVAFFKTGWPSAVRKIWPETMAAGLIFFLGALVAVLLVNSDPEWFYNFVPEMFSSGRGPDATAQDLRDVIYGEHDTDGLGEFSASLFTHNSAVAMFAFALGFAIGVPTMLLMFYNGTILGAFFAVHIEKGLGLELGGWLIIHGATEIFAIVLAGAAGLHIGRAAAFPGELSRVEAARRNGSRAGLVMGGVVVMLLLAGLIEGFLRQLITSDVIRYSFGLGSLALWCLYFYLPRGDDPEALL